MSDFEHGAEHDDDDLVPRDKHDLERVEAIKACGYPAIGPVLFAIIQWTIDPNWPIAWPLASYLCSLGEPIVAPVRAIIAGSDLQATYTWLGYMRDMDPPLVNLAFGAAVRRIAEIPTAREKAEEVDSAARDTLIWLQAWAASMREDVIAS